MKKFDRLLIGSIMALGCTVAAHASSPTGTWSADANGYSGTLIIGPVDLSGNFQGTFRNAPIKGFWNESSQRIVFWRSVGSNPNDSQVYTGYKFPSDHTHPDGSQRLTGYYEASPGAGGTALNNVSGWHAIK